MNSTHTTRRTALRQILLAGSAPWIPGLISGCSSTGDRTPQRVESRPFGTLPDGRSVGLHVLRNSRGASMGIMELGATITHLNTPDRSGNFASILIGGDSLETFLKGVPSASVIGRFANRIRNARFSIDGTEYRVTANTGPHHIHGGKEGFASKLWKSKVGSSRHGAWAEFSYRSVDGEEGYPGTVDVTVRYTLLESNAVEIRYEARTDRATVINLTNHAYFNLSGSGDVLDTGLQIFADHYTPSDQFLIPLGTLAPVVGTPLDFTKPHKIGERIQQIQGPSGYDHNFVLREGGKGLKRAAIASDPRSGRTLECLTTEPGVQLYTANHFNGRPHPKHGAFCLETQHYPDSPNLPQFPSVVLRPSKPFVSRTQFRFGTLG